MLEQLYPVFLLISVAAAGVCGIIITKNLSGNDVINSKIKRKYTEYITDLEASNKRLNGKLNQMKKGISITNESSSEPFSAISDILDQIAPSLPASIRPLLKSKKAMDFISSYVESNPGAVKDLIGKFVGKTVTGKKDNSENTTMESTL
jgi:hypothetical protein